MAKLDELKYQLKQYEDSIQILRDRSGHTPIAFDVSGIGYSGTETWSKVVSGGAVEGVIRDSGWFDQVNLLKKQIKEIEEAPPVFTYNYSSIYGTFTTQAETEPEAYQMFSLWLREKESQVTPEPQPEPIPEPTPTPEPAPIEAPLVTEPEPISIPEILPQVMAQPEISELITNDMIRQQVINFQIVDNRIIGSIKFVATEKFNPFYYGKNLLNLTQFKTPNGAAIRVKENILRFTQTERDEIINYNEDAQNNNRLTIESYVWHSVQDPQAFSKLYSVQVSEIEPPKPVDSGFMGAGIAGAIALLILGGFVADYKK